MQYYKKKRNGILMIQEIEPHKYENTYRPSAPLADSIVLYYEKNSVLLQKAEDVIAFPTFAEIAEQNAEIYDACTYLFSVDGTLYYLATLPDLKPSNGYVLEDVGIFKTAEPKHLAFAGITGHQLYHWYKNNKWCGRCGTSLVQDVKERMLSCPNCNHMVYPKISPAAIIGVIDGNRILMSKYAGRAYKQYALLAGFVEIGESVEETVRREVMEEVGLKVKNIRYYKSQPWSFSDTVLMGYYCDLDGSAKITLDREELALAEWIDREDIPEVSLRNSLTNEMIMKFRNREV